MQTNICGLKANAKAQSCWDPRIRLFFVLCLSLLAILCNSLAYLLPILVFTIVAMLLCKNKKVGFPIKRLWQFFLFFVIIALLQSVFSPSGIVIMQIASIKLITTGGLDLGCQFLCRMLIILLSAYILAAESNRRMIQGLIQWKMPYELAFMAATALHFIPIFSSEMKASLTAIQLRGVVIKKVPVKKRIKIYTYLLMPAMGNAIIRAKEMALAMEMRAFRAYDIRTSYVVLQLSVRDYLALIILIAFTAAILFAYYAGYSFSI